MKLSETLAGSFGTVEENTVEVEKNIADISVSSEEQAARITGVSDKMATISSVVKNTSVSADRAAGISEKLENESENLKKLVAKFTLVRKTDALYFYCLCVFTDDLFRFFNGKMGNICNGRNRNIAFE